jgi:hypothetical protein
MTGGSEHDPRRGGEFDGDFGIGRLLGRDPFVSGLVTL